MLPRFATERHYLTLLLCLPLLACCIKEQGSGDAGHSGDSEPGPNPGVPTLIDDEDFDGKVPVTFYASTAINCIHWKYNDRESGSKTLINKMLVYVAAACECPFSRAYITPFESKCDSFSGSLLVSTNITLPYNQPHDQFVNHLKNWVMTEPSFVKVLEVGSTTVNVVKIEFTHISSPGSGDPPTETPPSEPTSDPDREDTDGEGGSASGDLGGDVGGDVDDDFESSSVTISTDIYQLLLACIVVLGSLHLVNNS